MGESNTGSIIVTSIVIAFMLIISYVNHTAKAQERRELEEQRLKEQRKLEILQRKAERARREAIISMRETWGDDLCRRLIQKKIAPGMTADMVKLSWGEPDSVDQKEITKTGIDKERWIYGIPRKGANYIYFKNGEVEKIKQ